MGSAMTIGNKNAISHRLGISPNTLAMETLNDGEWDLQEEVAAVSFTFERARNAFPDGNWQAYLYVHTRHYKRVRTLLHQQGKKQAAVLFAEAERLKRDILFTTVQHGDVDFHQKMVEYTDHVEQRRTVEGPHEHVVGQEPEEEVELTTFN